MTIQGLIYQKNFIFAYVGLLGLHKFNTGYIRPNLVPYKLNSQISFFLSTDTKINKNRLSDYIRDNLNFIRDGDLYE